MRGALRKIGPLFALLLPPVTGAALCDIRLQDVTDELGIDFRHRHGGSGERYMVETMAGGLVIFDFDSDGDDDIFFVDGGLLPGYEGEPPRSRLFRNEGGRFVDHTDRSGIEVASYGCGAVAGDYDADGDLDLYITAFGENELWRNQGDGSFVNVTEQARVGGELWSAGAAFADFDRDGDLDLYVSNYVDWDLDNNKFCGDEARGLQGYCSPQKYNGLPDYYYRNLGDGTFRESAGEVGLGDARNAGLGVAVSDVDNDLWPDLFVANDSDSNFLFRNLGDGLFEDLSLLSGTAYGEAGRPEAGMGVDIGDVDNDGLLDIVVTNFELETNVLYKNLGGALFLDARFANNVAETSLLKLAFGVDLVDLDNDGDLDLVLANGHILDNASEFSAKSSYAQSNQILENLGDGRFALAEDSGFEDVLVSRGLATGDLDRDGDMDVVVLNSDGPAVVYGNVGGSDMAWIELDLVGVASNSLGVGARVTVSEGERHQIGDVRTSSSYLSQNALTLHFGLGSPADERVLVEIDWPSGRRQKLLVPVATRLRVVEL